MTATSEDNLIAQLEGFVTGFADSCATAVWGGNTYFVHTSSATVGPASTVIVKVLGVHGIGISGGAQIWLTS